ncbi:MAG: amino acid permease [Candidatus Eisenbacteria bacterium]
MDSTASNREMGEGRTLGLLGATGVGVGAIVGGGILALAGVAFASAGPGAILAFALNGVIALLTALSFAEMASAFPQSGGSYTYAKKVLSVRAAFAVGWVVWFASIVAGVLYAIGFGAYAVIFLGRLCRALFGGAPAWFASPGLVPAFALAAIGLYAMSLSRKGPGGGQAANIGKVVAFGVLIVGGIVVLLRRFPPDITGTMVPFLPEGSLGLFRAMGFTFIALQGFDLIAAGAGEVRSPARVIPRSMFLSLGAALAIYIPLLFLVTVIGAGPGETVGGLARRDPEALIAVAAQNYLGPAGFWIVVVAALLSMLSALHANLFAASRIVLAMARDRTLPRQLAETREGSGTPTLAILTSAFAVGTIVLVVGDVASAGAAASLIFLVSFALTHGMSVLARRRAGADHPPPFRSPWFPAVPVAGGAACVALALFQSFAVPSAGLLALFWLGLGGILYIALFGRRARVVDAVAEAHDPRLIRLRGRSPRVLVPIANPANAVAMVAVANALAPPVVGRVLLLSVVPRKDDQVTAETAIRLESVLRVLRNSLAASFDAGLSPEALTTVARKPWPEIVRVARTYHCESLLLGLTRLADKNVSVHLEALMSAVHSDVVVLRALPGWRFSEVKRILVPVGGRGRHDELRARLLGSLHRTGEREVTLLQVLPTDLPADAESRSRRLLERLAQDELLGPHRIEIVRSDAVAETVVSYAAKSDLVVLGLQRLGRRQRAFGDLALRIARSTNCGIIMISRRG